MPSPSSHAGGSPVRWSLLKWLRVLVAVTVFALLFLSFADFRQMFSGEAGHALASVQFVPALQSVLAGAVWPAALILGGLVVATLLFGRVYCSFVCPLGIFQDVMSRLARFRPGRKRKFLRHAAAVKWVRPAVVILAAVPFLFGAGWLVLPWLDPYSQFGRMVNMFVSPALAEGNNLLTGTSDFFYYIAPHWPRVGWLLLPVLVLLAGVVLLSLFRGRLYCNTVCPVGAVLGGLSRFAAFRVTFDEGMCKKCGMCMKACKSQCIDLKRQSIDYSRCVNCFNCTGACHEQGLRYRFTWKKGRPAASPPGGGKGFCSRVSAPASGPPVPPSPPGESVMSALPRVDRRAFLGASALGVWATLSGCRERQKTPEELAEEEKFRQHRKSVSRAISPAGSESVTRFLDHCTACHLCLDACPTKCLRPAYMEYGARGFLKPHLTFEESFCNFDCTACADVCPAGAILPIPLEKKKRTRIALARFSKKHCIVTLDKKDCGACSEHCPTKALDMVPFGEVVKQPEWNDDYCSRCGECFKACRYGAISRVPDPDFPGRTKPVFDLRKCVGCRKCEKACEGGALTMKPGRFDIRIPKLASEACIGCGACEFACPEKAIVVSALPVHEEALQIEQKKVIDPNEGEDFPF